MDRARVPDARAPETGFPSPMCCRWDRTIVWRCRLRGSLGNTSALGAIFYVGIIFGPFWQIWRHKPESRRNFGPTKVVSKILWDHFFVNGPVARPNGPFWVPEGASGTICGKFSQNGPNLGRSRVQIPGRDSLSENVDTSCQLDQTTLNIAVRTK